MSDEAKIRALPTIEGNRVAVAREDGLMAAVVIKSVVPALAGEAPASKVLSEEDLFGPAVIDIVPPPYPLAFLTTMGEQNGDLADCVDVYAKNIDGYGQSVVARFTGLDADPADVLVAEAFVAAAANDLTMTELRQRTRRDLELTGNAYWEVVRDLVGKPRMITHIPSYQMRLLREAKNGVVAVTRHVLRLAGRVEIVEIPVVRRFRRYVQGQAESITGLTGQSMTGRQRWFKQWGDPRDMDCETGLPVDAEHPIPYERRATEIMHFRLYSARSSYGIPRWVGKTPDLLGGRAASEINHVTIDQNNIPSMAVTVDGGQLTAGSVARLEAFHRQVMAGERNWSTVLVLEGELAAENDGLEGNPRVRIGIRSLNDVRIKDALFSEYCVKCRQAVRASFRLPGIFFGEVEGGNTKANAEVARKLTDEQVFAPERAAFDAVVNRLFVELGLKTVVFRSATPNVTDNAELVAMLTAAERTGGVTPRIARDVVRDIFPAAATAPPIDPAKLDPDKPYSLTMAVEVRNTGGAAGPAEATQTVAPVFGHGNPREVVKADHVDTVEALLNMGDRAADEIRRSLR